MSETTSEKADRGDYQGPHSETADVKMKSIQAPISTIELEKLYASSVSDLLLAQVQHGVAPWQKFHPNGERYLPYNGANEVPFTGINSLYLAAIAHERGFSDARWYTASAAQARGAKLLPDALGAIVEIYSWSRSEPMVDPSGNLVLDAQGNPRNQVVQYEMPKAWHCKVFNAEELEGGIERAPADKSVEYDEVTGNAARFLEAGPVDITIAPGSKSAYHSKIDQLVLSTTAHRTLGWYRSALYAKAQWAASEHRLDFSGGDEPPSSAAHAPAVLRAQIASLAIGDHLQLGYKQPPSEAYIEPWSKMLSEDARAIFRIAAEATRVNELLMDLAYPEQDLAQSSSIVEIPMPIIGDKQDRTYLAVPYAEKDQARALGARWDQAAGAWYAPPGADIAAFGRWDIASASFVSRANLPPEAQFAEALRAAGFQIKGEPIMNGELQRVPVAGDVGAERSGAYTGYLDGRPAGYMQNFRTGLKTNWKASLAPPVPLERETIAAQAAERRQEREASFAKLYAAAAVAASEEWANAKPVDIHPYLVAKGVQPHGLRTNAEGELLVPVQSPDRQIWNLQRIREDGQKGFAKGGRVTGGSFLLGDPNKPGPLLIAEGFSTAATLNELTGQPVAVAFTANNLTAVAEAYRARFPERPLVIAGDNDHRRETEVGPDGKLKPNIGALKAREAADAVQGMPLLPAFDSNSPGSDWNDLVAEKGADHVSVILNDGLEIASLQQDGVLSVKRAMLKEITAAKEIEADREKELERSQERSLGLGR